MPKHAKLLSLKIFSEFHQIKIQVESTLFVLWRTLDIYEWKLEFSRGQQMLTFISLRHLSSLTIQREKWRHRQKLRFHYCYVLATVLFAISNVAFCQKRFHWKRKNKMQWFIFCPNIQWVHFIIFILENLVLFSIVKFERPLKICIGHGIPLVRMQSIEIQFALPVGCFLYPFSWCERHRKQARIEDHGRRRSTPTCLYDKNEKRFLPTICSFSSLPFCLELPSALQ